MKHREMMPFNFQRPAPGVSFQKRGPDRKDFAKGAPEAGKPLRQAALVFDR
jgi:hypothetical protein